MPVIKFVKEKKEIEVPDGANLRDEAIKAGVNVNCAISGISEGIDSAVHSFSKIFNCHGFGLCGTCRVNITKGMENTNKLTMAEKAKKYVPVPDPLPSLAFIGNEDTMRLACKTTVHGDIEVESAPELDLFGENFFS
ncbi:MAG: ferredoxin [Planctomycetota bacterium]